MFITENMFSGSSSFVSVTVLMLFCTNQLAIGQTTVNEIPVTESSLMDIAISITSAGPSTAGEIYSLECSVTITGSNDQPTIIWLDDGAVIASADVIRNVSKMSMRQGIYSSTLIFTPLAVSDEGQFICRVTLGEAMKNLSIAIIVRNPVVSVIIDANGALPVLGSTYSLTCNIAGVERLNGTVAYQWFKNGMTVPDHMLRNLSFSSLTISDAGTYTCQITVISSLLMAPIIANSSMEIFQILPDPTVTITSDPVSPIWPIGSDVNLTCIVELPISVMNTSESVTVNTEWNGPQGFMSLNVVQPNITENITTYKSVAMVNSFGREESGEYSCTATLSLQMLNIHSMAVSKVKRVTVGVYLSLNGQIYANNSLVKITEIRQSTYNADGGLKCITDRMPCCRNPQHRLGEWYFPDQSRVPIQGVASTFYRNRGNDGSVNLNRLNNNIPAPFGQFCCEVLDAANDSWRLCAAIVSVVITSSGSSTADANITLTCSLSGTSDCDSASFQWFKGPSNNRSSLTDDDSLTIHSNSSISQLHISSLRASHAGSYTCQATVRNIVEEDTEIININLPPPVSVTVIPPTGAIIAGSSQNFTCNVELSPVVDVPVTVSTVWTGPAGFTSTKLARSVMGSTINYTVILLIDAVRNGNYTCQASVSRSIHFTSDGTMSEMATPSIVPLPSPVNLVADGMTISIHLTWEQPVGSADAVGSYEINYTYVVDECRSEGGNIPPVTVTLSNGSLASYTLKNSSSTPVEEDSIYSITLIARNSVTESRSDTALTATHNAAPGMPQSLVPLSVSVANITIQWDRVNCRERNGPTDSYRVVYYPTSNPSDRYTQTVVGIRDEDRVFSVTGLPPRTSYTFEVQASNPVINVHGAPATITVITTPPQTIGFLLRGTLYPNNSLVSLDDIGTNLSRAALFCLTPSTECCSDNETPDAVNVLREWYLPNGRPVSSATKGFCRRQVSSAVSLYRNIGDTLNFTTGVFRCEIPDASREGRILYVGIYPQGVGFPSVVSITFNRTIKTLTCASTGGPPATVIWMKNGTPINDSLYQWSQRLVDAETATYDNVLFNNDVASFVGNFTCQVSNVRGTAIKIVHLNGVSIIHGSFIVGQPANVSCISDIETTSGTTMEWLHNNDIVGRATSTQQLDLVFSPVNDSIHGHVYVCRVTGDDEEYAEKSFTVEVDVPPGAITVTVRSSGIVRAGLMYNLTCTVSKAIDGLINFPITTWSTGVEMISNRDNISVSSGMNNGTTILHFNPLKTSHQGRYICNGTLTSPALDTPLMSSTVEVLHVQISTPNVNIIVSLGSLFAGGPTPLSLTCTININPATNSLITANTVDVTWWSNMQRLSNNNTRVSISSVYGSELAFMSTLTLSPPSITDRSFICRARVRPQPQQQTFITASETGEDDVAISVEAPLPPTVRIAPYNSLAIAEAGGPFTLTCSASTQEGIGISATPTLMWTRDGDTLPIVSGPGPLILSLSPLHTSDAGPYTCTARLNIPEVGVDVSGTNTTNIFVQIPVPVLTISGNLRNMSFFQGLNLALTCSVTLAETVDTPVTVQGTWIRNGTELMNGGEGGRITISNVIVETPPYEITLRLIL